MEDNKVIFAAVDWMHYPEYKTALSAGWDLRSNVMWNIAPHDIVKIPSWLKVKLPDDYVLIVKPRSSLAVNKWLLVIEWTIDADYRWEISIVVYNMTDEVVTIDKDERIAQALIMKRPEYSCAYSMNYDNFADEYPTERWEWWFGSTWNK